jgi:hypothetical protein
MGTKAPLNTISLGAKRPSFVNQPALDMVGNSVIWISPVEISAKAIPHPFLTDIYRCDVVVFAFVEHVALEHRTGSSYDADEPRGAQFLLPVAGSSICSQWPPYSPF